MRISAYDSEDSDGGGGGNAEDDDEEDEDEEEEEKENGFASINDGCPSQFPKIEGNFGTLSVSSFPKFGSISPMPL